MKQVRLVPIIILALAVASACVIQNAFGQHTADGKSYLLASPITIVFPSNTTYYSDHLTLNVTFKASNSPSLTSMNYSIDGKENATVPLNAVFEPIYALRTYPNGTTETVVSMYSQYVYTGEVSLTELSQHEHNIAVYTQYTGNNVVGYDSKQVSFFISSNEEENATESMFIPAKTSPSPSLNPTPTAKISAVPSLTSSLSPSPTAISSASPTQQPTTEPIQSASPTPFKEVMSGDMLPLQLELAVVAVTVLFGILAYFTKYNRKTMLTQCGCNE